MNCVKCGAENSEGSKRCGRCGAALESSEVSGNGHAIAFASLAPIQPGGEARRLGDHALVGRLETADFSLNHKSVSREHARLERQADGYVVRDLGSTNGTLVNGKRIEQPTPLRSGDVVTFGSVEYRYEQERTGPRGMSALAARLRRAAANREEEEDSPTMHDLPSVPVSFPPQEGVPAEVEDEESAEPPPPSPQAMPSPESEDPEGRSTLPAAAELTSNAADVTSAESGTAEEAVRLGEEAVATMHRLSDLVDTLSARLRESERAGGELRSQIAAQADAEGWREEVGRLLHEVPDGGMAEDELNRLQHLLDSLIQDPRDAAILLKVGVHAQNLSAIVKETAALRRIVHRIRSELDVAAS